MLVDRKFRLPRIWSNNELKKFSDLFRGDIVNISAWRDEDKEGKQIRDYSYKMLGKIIPDVVQLRIILWQFY